VRILTIDPGSHTGWATDHSGRLEWGAENFSLKRGETSGNRWRRFGHWLEKVTLPDFVRLSPYRKPAHVAEPPYEPVSHPFNAPSPFVKVDLVVYERSEFQAKARAAAEIAAAFTSRLEEHCELHGIPLQPVHVQKLKAFAIPDTRTKETAKQTRDRRARKEKRIPVDRGKPAMVAAAFNRLHRETGYVGKVIGKKPDGVTDVDFCALSEDEADALWLYWYAKEVLT